MGESGESKARWKSNEMRRVDNVERSRMVGEAVVRTSLKVENAMLQATEMILGH